MVTVIFKNPREPKFTCMNDQDRNTLREKITAAIAKTKNKIVELEEATQPIAPENSIGRISRMDAINNKSVAEAALRTSRHKLEKLNFALSKIDSADFGTCSRCKQPIPPARLMYLPESTRCVNCADR